MKGIRLLIMGCCLLVLGACKGRQAGEPSIAVTIEPQRYFAERIAGDKFRIYSVVPSGQSPETYDPTPRQMAEIGESAAYFRIGPIGFEQAWMDKIRENNPELKIFDLSEGMYRLESAGEAHHDHHHAGGVDPHIWSSVKGAQVIARNTRDALVALDPDHEAYYRANYERLAADLQQAGDTIAAWLAPLRGKAFIIYHPALTYFADAYGLEQLCIETDGKEPSPSQLKKLVEEAETHGAEVVFIQEEFDRKNAELVAKETGCRLVQINPLAYDWNGEMMRITKALADGQTD